MKLIRQKEKSAQRGWALSPSIAQPASGLELSAGQCEFSLLPLARLDRERIGINSETRMEVSK